MKPLTQPEELETALKTMEIDDSTEQRQESDERLLINPPSRNWNTGYLPPYRAAYMRDHGLEM